MAIFDVKVIVGSKYVSRNDTGEKATMLCMVSSDEVKKTIIIMLQ